MLHPAVGRAKPIPGDAADNLCVLLIGSALLEAGGARSVQDALSFRVVPEAHGVRVMAIPIVLGVTVG